MSSEMSDDLKPCPFCGALPVRAKSQIACRNTTVCRCVVTTFTKHDPMAAWNTRPIEDQLRAELEYKRQLPQLTNDELSDAVTLNVKLTAELSALMAEYETVISNMVDERHHYAQTMERLNNLVGPEYWGMNLVDAVENEFKKRDEAKAETDRTREINVRMLDIQVSLRTELAAAKDENATLRLALQSLRMDHFVLEEDCWYSCPKSGQCCNDNSKTECTCSADRINAIIDAALKVKL